jgi:hypothetical protein
LGFSFFGIEIFKVNSIDYPHFLTPSLWIVDIWIFIFIWQLAWLVYGISTIFRKSSSDYLYKYPPVMHWLIYLNFGIANIINILTLILWNQQQYLVI